MNHKKREETIKAHLEVCQKIRTEKNIEYANSNDDANACFNSDNDIGLTSIQSVGVFMNKHYRSIRSWIKTGEVFSDEQIEGRIYDLINYLLILLTLIEDKKQE